jgi:hypothetical protein
MSSIVVKTEGGKRRRSFDATGYVAKKAKQSRQKKYGLSTGLKQHKFIRACTFGQSYVIGIDTRTGFSLNGTSTGLFNMQFNFCLSGVNASIGGASPTLLPLPAATEFSALYDQYRIDYVDCQFMFSNNQSSVNSPGTVLPIMYLAKDYDDSNVANYTDLQQYSTQKTWQLGQHRGDGIYHVKVKPNVDVTVYQSALLTGYARGKPMFIDTSSPAVPHYGIKIAYDPIFTPAASTNVGYLTCNFVFHMTMNNTK